MSNMEMLQPHETEPRPSAEELLNRGGGYHHEPAVASALLSNNMDPHDLENPHNWPLHRKLFTSFAAWCMAASV